VYRQLICSRTYDIAVSERQKGRRCKGGVVLKKRILAVSMALIVGFATMFIFGSGISQAQPGGADDPLVTRSYVDARFDELLRMIIRDPGTGQPDLGNQNIIDQIVDMVVSQINQESSLHTPVFVNSGGLVIGAEGTEIILRSGSATGHVPGQNGIVNITAGTEISHGSPIPVNHMLIVPRDDGRGVRTTSNSWFIIKGDFNVFR